MRSMAALMSLSIAFVFVCEESAHAQVPQIERDALIAFYNATNGDGWERNTGWLGPVGTECDWLGVACGDGHVTMLAGASNRLEGTLPAELADLSQLEFLLLTNNKLSGEIPPELGSLSNLEQLYLEKNKLTGGIPPELADLSSLSYMNLSENRLTGGIPPVLGTMAALDALVLSKNPLGGKIPPELGDLSSLQGLRLFRAQLTGRIPPELGDLANLERLWLGSNRLHGDLPVEIMSLSNLQSGNGVDLRWNALHTDDADLLAFITPRQMAGVDWRESQTIAPKNVTVGWIGDHTAWLSWDPVDYQSDPGYYKAHAVPSAGGTPRLLGQTASKAEVEIPATALDPGVSYELVVRTVTKWHDSNPTLVTSDPSDIAMATTSDLGCARPAIEMTWDDPTTLSVPGSFDGYLWNTGETSPAITVSPYERRFYWVTVTNSGPCQESAIILVDEEPIFSNGFESGNTTAW